MDVSGGRETILLDTTSIKGTQFNLIDKSAEGFTIERYQVNCQNKIFVLLAVRVYDANQKLVLATDDEPTNPRRYGDNTPVGRSAAIVCPTR